MDKLKWSRVETLNQFAVTKGTETLYALAFVQCWVPKGTFGLQTSIHDLKYVYNSTKEKSQRDGTFMLNK